MERGDGTPVRYGRGDGTPVRYVNPMRYGKGDGTPLRYGKGGSVLVWEELMSHMTLDLSAQGEARLAENQRTSFIVRERNLKFVPLTKWFV